MCKFRKRVPDLCASPGPRRKHQTDQRLKINQKNRDNFTENV